MKETIPELLYSPHGAGATFTDPGAAEQLGLALSTGWGEKAQALICAERRLWKDLTDFSQRT